MLSLQCVQASMSGRRTNDANEPANTEDASYQIVDAVSVWSFNVSAVFEGSILFEWFT